MENSFLTSGELTLTNPPVYSGEFRGVSEYFQFERDLYFSNKDSLSDLRLSLFPERSEKLLKGTELLSHSLNNVLKILLDEDSRYLHRRYRADAQKMIEHLKLIILPTLDLPGFSQGCHLDNRMVVAAGSINLQDNLSSTAFFSASGGKEKLFQSPGKKDMGTIWLNTEQTWHGVPEVSEERTTLLIQWVWI